MSDLCPISWWNPGDRYMYPHVCGREEGHKGRHTCVDEGCRSWRPELKEDSE